VAGNRRAPRLGRLQLCLPNVPTHRARPAAVRRARRDATPGRPAARCRLRDRTRGERPRGRHANHGQAHPPEPRAMRSRRRRVVGKATGSSARKKRLRAQVAGQVLHAVPRNPRRLEKPAARIPKAFRHTRLEHHSTETLVYYRPPQHVWLFLR
jgi:hypothetical protein